MLLDRTGKVRVRQTGKRAHQTLVAEQVNGHLLVLKTTETVSLHALGECLRDAFPSLRQVMAMDGGSSSDVAVSPSLRQATSKMAGFHTWIPLVRRQHHNPRRASGRDRDQPAPGASRRQDS